MRAKNLRVTRFRGVLKTQANILDGAFYENS